MTHMTDELDCFIKCWVVGPETAAFFLYPRLGPTEEQNIDLDQR